MKNDKFLPCLTIVSVVAIVAIVALFLWSGGVEGATIGETFVDEEQVPCVDDEPLNDFDIAGTLRHGKILYEDYCMDGVLYQHHCPTSNTVRLLTGYECPNGGLNGACVR